MADKTFDIGINTLKKAYIFIDNNQFDEALVYLDKAVSLGVKEAFQDRAWCLQALGYDLDAIEDFDKAMLTAPHDANLYFGRGLSKSATGDLNGAVLDGELAVTFSKYENEINEWRNKEAQKKGHESATKLYELHLAMWKQNLNFRRDMLDKFTKMKEDGVPNADILMNDFDFPKVNLKRR